MSTNRELTAPAPPRSPWQRVYGAGHILRRRWYERRARHLPRPVLSVGNLHWGGTGKTPLTAAVAAHLRDRGRRLAILSRGYARRDRGVRVVSTGEGPLLGPLLAGDEPVLLAGSLPGVAVVVGADRHEAGRHALERLEPPPELFLLDDGFSHLALARDLDLLVFPAADPFGGGRLPPGGRLREPLAAVERADAVLLSGGEPGEGDRLAQCLRPYGFDGPGFACRRRLLAAVDDRGELLASGTPVLLVSGIARPEDFAAAAREAGFEVVGEMRFPDHHPYPEASLQRISRTLEESGAGRILTTAKDGVKLRGRLPAPFAELPLAVEPEAGFWSWLDRRLEVLEDER